MIIGIDASRANVEKKTGVEWYAWHIIEELKKITTEGTVQFVLYSDKELKGELAKMPNNWSSRVLHWGPGRFWTQLRLSFEMLKNKPDILFVPAHVPPLIRPKKTVIMIHDIAAATFPKSYTFLSRWLSLSSAKKGVNKLWKVLVPTEFVKNEIKTKFKFNDSEIKRVVPIFHGYDKKYNQDYSQGDIDFVLNKYGIKKPFLLSVGRLEEKKNTKRIVEAFNFPEYQLVLVGKPGVGFEDVILEIEKNKFNNNILSPGYLDQDDLVLIMKAAEVFVFPSLQEGFGIPILQAMAAGTPVVTSGTESLREVGGEVCIYVNPLNVDEIREGINKILLDKNLRNKKVELGLERAGFFSWEKCARETLAVLLE